MVVLCIIVADFIQFKSRSGGYFKLYCVMYII